jgi:hypothetical protein
VGECHIGFRNPYDRKPDTETVEAKIEQLQGFAKKYIC